MDINLSFIQSDDHSRNSDKNHMDLNYFSLFKIKALRKDTIGFMGFMFAVQVIYYGG